MESIKTKPIKANLFSPQNFLGVVEKQFEKTKPILRD